MKIADYHLVTLAGLLHDIGKFVRSQPQGEQAKQPYGRASEARGGHATDGVNFLAELGAQKLPDWTRLQDLIAAHHTHQWQTEQQSLGWLVTTADWYSSMERLSTSREETDRPHLEAIFSQVQTIYPTPARQYQRVGELSPSRAFPVANPPQFNAFTRQVQTFAEQARALLTATQDLPHLLVGFTDLLERYATVTTADKRDFPYDVSLFDHLSTTAAIAACQYLYHASLDRWTESALQDQTAAKFLLIGGDLSGIQNYLYEIAQIGPGGVAKRLRARSFYLTALLHVIVFRLRQELAAHLGATLPANCQLLATGGRFLLLAPNLPQVTAQLEQIDRAINQWLRTETHGDLACYFTALPLAGQDFIPKVRLPESDAPPENPPGRSSITDKIDEVYQRLNRAKQRRYHALLRNGEGWQTAFVQRQGHVHYPPGDGRGAGGACRSCNKLPVEPRIAAETGLNLCRRCHEDRELGRRLLTTHYLAYRQGKAPAAADAFDLTFFAPNEAYTLRLAEAPAALTNFAPAAVEYLATDEQCAESPEAYAQRRDAVRTTSYRYPLRHRYLANYVPSAGGEITAFDDLAKRAGRADQPKPVEPYLGVVKLDVDQLGLLIAEGLGKATSLSRVATFSRMLDLFFNGWLDTKLRRPQLYDDNGKPRLDAARAPLANPFREIYTVYAGGDDVLLVGPWDTAVLAARDLQADFHRYTTGNPNLTLSATVVVAKPRYPVAKLARRAGEQLEQGAKALGRNRFHLFGITTPWYHRTPRPGRDRVEQELHQTLTDDQGLTTDALWAWAEFFDDQLYAYIQARANQATYPISNILLHRLLRLSQLGQRLYTNGSGAIRDLTYMAQVAYQLGRNVKEKDFPDAATYQAVAPRLMTLTQLNNLKLMAHLQLPLMWALYRNRQRSSEDE